jgi:hypothetical protein
MKTIIEMAGKAFETPGVEPAFRNGFWTVTSEELERFAALVEAAARADERERIIAANIPEIEKTNAHIKMLEDEIAAIRARGQSPVCCEEYNTCVRPCTPRGRHHGQEAEREACAKVCDAEEETANEETWYQCAKELAKQIRARGQA